MEARMSENHHGRRMISHPDDTMPKFCKILNN